MQRYAIFGLSRVMDNTVTVTELMLGGPAKKLYQEKYMNFPVVLLLTQQIQSCEVEGIKLCDNVCSAKLRACIHPCRVWYI
jgi:hypothetical protein